MRAVLLLALALASPATAGEDPVAETNAVYQACFNKAAPELFAAGVTHESKLLKAVRKRCKIEREDAIDAMQVSIMLMGNPTGMSRGRIADAIDYRIAHITMKKLGFEGY